MCLRIIVVCGLLITRLGQLDLGVRLDKHQVPKDNTTMCVATPSQTYPCAFLIIKGIKFKVGYDEKSRRIRYLSTQDQNFTTPEGVHVGMSMKVREDELIALPGWKIFGSRARSGWRPVFGFLRSGVTFSDGTFVDLSQARHAPPRAGELIIQELEKGGV